MLFNSIDFALFLPLVFILYWYPKNKSYNSQNILLLLSSYFFYACWDWRFLFLLLFSTLLDYFSGIKISNSSSPREKKIWFWISVIVNLGLLVVLKYFNFFATSLASFAETIGVHLDPFTLQVILPVGISFYTFHGLSYVIDIYKDRIKPEYNFISYSVFVCFFPLLVAGPIERATHLLPQIKKKRVFDYSRTVDGMRQILWGLFKKIVIADSCAYYANLIFNNYTHYQGSDLFLGAIFFTFQIYGDFSGYSDIALGTARMLGIDLLKNFNYPYFSRDIAEFWRRWHISLSTWFRDYLYIPLGGSKGGTWGKIRNTFIIFIVSGFWHGANWTFIVWGALNAFYYLPLLLKKTNRMHVGTIASNRILPSIKEFSGMITTFLLTVFAWIVFRSASIQDSFIYFKRMFNISIFEKPTVLPFHIFLIIVFFIIIEWMGRNHNYAIEGIDRIHLKAIRWSFYFVLLFLTFLFFGSNQAFIYFQF
jgi:hypothetical protein